MSVPGRIKICGITDEAALDACIAARVDWVGFVFHPTSPRAIAPARARALAAHLPSAIRTVGLFVKPADALVAETLDVCPLDVLQLYETPDRAADLRARFGRETWLACPIAQADEIASLPGEGRFDRLLIEARAPTGVANPGGHGTQLDWGMLSGRLDSFTWMLAGGLDPTNVADAIEASGATSVDVSSGVERARGVKDPAMITAFAEAARAGQARLQRGGS